MTETVVVITASSAIVGPLLWVIFGNNRLIRQRNQVRPAWAQVDVQLKRWPDWIRNLVETVRGYAAHESATMQAVVHVRANVVTTVDPTRRSTVAGLLEQSLGRLFVVAGHLPWLRATWNSQALQTEWANTEDKIAYARQFYNGAVQSYKTTVQSIPTNLVAGLTNLQAAGLLSVDVDERDPIQVRF